MDYAKLAVELLQKMQVLRKARLQQSINESLQGAVFVLGYITYRSGSVLPGDINQEMGVSSARIAVALNKLESRGLIIRQIDQNDRRKVLVEVTQEGRKLAEKHRREVLDNAQKMLNLLGEHDAREYVRITGKLADIITK